MKRHNLFGWVLQVGSPVSAFIIARDVYLHERTLGLYCPVRSCGPDDLPMWLFLGLWAVFALVSRYLSE